MAEVEIDLRALPSLLANSEGWEGLRAALAAGQSGTIDGAWGSSAALAVAALSAEAPVLAILPLISDIAGWAEDLAGFCGERPWIFPAWETWPPPTHHGHLAPETTQRLRLLQQLLDPGAAPRVILTPMAALLQPVPARKTSPGKVVD